MAKRPPRYEDLLALPDEVVGEILNGELVTSPRPSNRDSVVSSFLGAKLTNPFSFGSGGPGGWWILDEPELHLGPDILVPDLAGWRKERMPVVPDEPFFTLAPDWICEILSPRTAGIDLKHKLPIYARERVEYAWILNPPDKTLQVMKREGAQWLLLATFSGDDKARAEPFDAVELELGALWPDKPPAPASP